MGLQFLGERTVRVTLDPAELISPPFLACPKCGRDSFGVLMVGDHRCTRRCRVRECWFTQAFPLPQLRKKVVYIDQLALSEMLKTATPEIKGHEGAKANPLWRTMYEKLNRACALQLVVCPSSHLHRDESLVSPFFGQLREMYEHFSGGIKFQDGETIRRDQLFVAAVAWAKREQPTFDCDPKHVTRGYLHDPHEWLPRIQIIVEADYGPFIDGIRTQREKTADALLDVFGRWQTETGTFDEWYQQEIAAYGPALMERYVRDLAQRAAHMNAVKAGKVAFDPDAMFPSFAEICMIVLVKAMKKAEVPDDKTFDAMIEFLRLDSMFAVPFIRINASYWASFAVKVAAGQKDAPQSGSGKRRRDRFNSPAIL
jgi:hypothetical protein